MNQHKPIAERYPALLRLLEDSQSDVQRSESTVRRLANKEFIRSLSLLEHTLSGEEELTAVKPTADPVLTELDELADAVADIEAYMKEHQQVPTVDNSDKR
ncbi:MAG: hypothetical protein NT070_09870 [Cyanobacteria bacterium]|nr:hypothetical protein [Cyanobacteriota bacterium]